MSRCRSWSAYHVCLDGSLENLLSTLDLDDFKCSVCLEVPEESSVAVLPCGRALARAGVPTLAVALTLSLWWCVCDRRRTACELLASVSEVVFGLPKL